MIKIEFLNAANLSDKIRELSKAVTNLQPMFELMAGDFYKEEKTLFQLQGPGKFPDLSPAYKKQKQKRWGRTYPILFASGRLAYSLMSRNGLDAVCIIRPQFMALGTSTPYAVYHHSMQPRRVTAYTGLPRRRLWEEETELKWDTQTDAGTAGNLFYRWNRQVDNYFKKAVEGLVK